MRSHDQFNTTIYGENDRYRGIYGGRRVVFLNAEDMRELRHREGPDASISISHFERRAPARRALQGRPLRDPARLRRRLLPGDERARAASAAVADGSNQPASKSIVITLEPRAAAPGG